MITTYEVDVVVNDIFFPFIVGARQRDAGKGDDPGGGSGGNSIEAGRDLEARLIVYGVRVVTEDCPRGECLAPITGFEPGDCRLLRVLSGPDLGGLLAESCT